MEVFSSVNYLWWKSKRGDIWVLNKSVKKSVTNEMDVQVYCLYNALPELGQNVSKVSG